MPETFASRVGMREDMKNLGTHRLALCAIAMASFLPGASAQEKTLEGFVIGRVYEIDKEDYREYIEAKRAQDSDFDEMVEELDAMEFVDEREEVTVTGRQLATNATFVSELSDEMGEYAIRETPVGTYEFTLRHEGVDYPVKQRLDLNIQLDYVAELCFVIDREEQVAWMAADDARRTSDVPPWVPRTCVSHLSACLALITGTDGTLPDGLLLLLAGSGATATAIGIISSDQVEASSPVPQNEER